MNADDKVYCEVPTPGKAGTNIPRWKYETIRKIILKLLKEQHEEGVLFRELPNGVSHELSDAERTRLGSVTWHVTTVKLDLEAKGLIKRRDNKSPQRLVLA